MCVTIRANPKVKPEQLVQFLADWAVHFQYLIAADWREVHFIHFNQRGKLSIETSYSGRAFGPDAELRWRRSEDDKHFVCRWISENCPVSLSDGWRELPEEEPKDFTPADVSYLLWGEPLWKVDDSEWQEENGEKIWYQARIPRKLTYPISEKLAGKWKVEPQDKKPLVLHVREYKLKGQTMFERFIALDRYESTNKKQKNEEGKS